MCKFPLCTRIEERDGYCFLHAKLYAGEKTKAGNKNAAEDKKKLDQWFIDRSKETTGKCYECGGKTTKGDKKYWKFTICHILSKSIFKSVATHPLNCVELCHFGNSHHANFDNNGYEYVKLNMPKTWAFIVERFNMMYNDIAKSERKNIPDVLIQELNLESLKK